VLQHGHSAKGDVSVQSTATANVETADGASMEDDTPSWNLGDSRAPSPMSDAFAPGSPRALTVHAELLEARATLAQLRDKNGALEVT
jgi:hypothetical protein